MSEAKPFSIAKRLVWEAYERVKANRGAAGVDGQSLAAFEKDLKGNLYKIWNRMSSGCYFAPPVRLVEIPKADGKLRPLGIPTVSDRIAQMVVKLTLEPTVEPMFHRDSYGYRPGRSALDAVAVARERCWRMDWVIDLDIRDFFGSLDHGLMMKALKHNTDLKWIHLYVERWLKAPVQLVDGTLRERIAGTPQGGVVSPVLSNLFMHYAFDQWMAREYSAVPFERYADDALIHCVSLAQAEAVLEAVRQRLKECGLELHPEKMKIVYCKDSNRRGAYELQTFDFLGYTFRPRRAEGRDGRMFVSFIPAMSSKAAKAVRTTIRGWNLAKGWNTHSLAEVAKFVNPFIRGWMNYYGRFHRSKCLKTLAHVNLVLATWAKRRYKRFKGSWWQAFEWLVRIAKRDESLLVLWTLGARPTIGRLGDKSRMRRESHVRICESVGVKFPCATRQGPSRPFKGHAGAESLTGHVLRASRSLGSIRAESDGPASCHKAGSFMPRLLMASPREPRPQNPQVGVHPPGNACGRPLGPGGGYCGTPHERRCLPSPGQRSLGSPGPPRAGHPRAESPSLSEILCVSPSCGSMEHGDHTGNTERAAEGLREA